MGRIYRPIILRNGRKTVHIVAFVDSGADSTVMSERVAKQLGIRPSVASNIEMADGRSIPTVIGKVVVESPRDSIKKGMFVDITDIPFEQDMDDVDMILGLDFLQENGIQLSFGTPKKRHGRVKTRAG